MDYAQLFYPVFAMALLPALVMIRILYVRVRALMNNEIELHFLENNTVPPMSVTTSTHNLANLFEFPVIFFIAIILAMVMRIQDPLMIILAWSYVATRYLHTAIHLSVNAVIPRFTVFSISNLLLIAIWLRLLAVVTNADIV